ncbi:hypothetical protein Q3G72_017104 [Acer saccharum]|nr:hypothetical protein Q3G72_017104 [Acer saccharum]
MEEVKSETRSVRASDLLYSPLESSSAAYRRVRCSGRHGIKGKAVCGMLGFKVEEIVAWSRAYLLDFKGKHGCSLSGEISLVNR